MLTQRQRGASPASRASGGRGRGRPRGSVRTAEEQTRSRSPARFPAAGQRRARPQTRGFPATRAAGHEGGRAARFPRCCPARRARPEAASAAPLRRWLASRFCVLSGQSQDLPGLEEEKRPPPTDRAAQGYTGRAGRWGGTAAASSENLIVHNPRGVPATPNCPTGAVTRKNHTARDFKPACSSLDSAHPMKRLIQPRCRQSVLLFLSMLI